MWHRLWECRRDTNVLMERKAEFVGYRSNRNYCSCTKKRIAPVCLHCVLINGLPLTAITARVNMKVLVPLLNMEFPQGCIK